MEFTLVQYQNLLLKLSSLSDDKYKKFTEKLIPSPVKIYGVSLPKLRLIAKEIIKSDWRGFLAVVSDDSHEELLLQGIVISYAKTDIDERLKYTLGFVNKINNWAVCDTFCSSFKPSENEKQKVFNFICGYLPSKEEFELRFFIVMLISSFIDEEHIDFILKTLNNIKHEGYYVKMAVAWALSICFVKFRGKTLSLLENNELDDFTHNKTIQKTCESFRVSSEDKEMIKRLKR
ncbi:MAG: DNA alkylation repair protein [Eubacteriales bacterium]